MLWLFTRRLHSVCTAAPLVLFSACLNPGAASRQSQTKGFQSVRTHLTLTNVLHVWKEEDSADIVRSSYEKTALGSLLYIQSGSSMQQSSRLAKLFGLSSRSARHVLTWLESDSRRLCCISAVLTWNLKASVLKESQFYCFESLVFELKSHVRQFFCKYGSI